MHYDALTQRINTYFALLLITIAGAGASMLIIHVAYTNASSSIIVRSANYGDYLQSPPKHD